MNLNPKWLVMAIGMVALLGSPGWARKPLRQDLTSTGVDDNARGSTKLTLRTDDTGHFEVAVHRLDRRATFELLVNGVKVGELHTNFGGNGRLRFRTRPRGKDLKLGFDPRGAHVEVRDDAGEDVLETDIPDDTDPADVACCLPAHGDDGAECEDRTADECAQEGGTPSTATSCLPNPCAGGTPPGEDEDVVCCLPGGGGEAETECEDRTEAECAAANGTVVSATSCTPDPCAATPPANLTACCTPEDAGFECELRSADVCAARGGTSTAATACGPDACTGVTPPPAAETACCVADDGGFECEPRTAADCAARNGTSTSAATCDPNPCPGPLVGSGGSGGSGSGGSGGHGGSH